MTAAPACHTHHCAAEGWRYRGAGADRLAAWFGAVLATAKVAMFTGQPRGRHPSSLPHAHRS
jgi:hypothetical protein